LSVNAGSSRNVLEETQDVMKRQKQATTFPELSAAVRRVRQSYQESQAEFAQRTELALMTISKFERGVRVPADPRVLARLAAAARAQGLTEDAKQFENAAILAAGKIEELSDLRPGLGLAAIHIPNLPTWRLMHAAAIAIQYFPEVARAIEDAAGPAIAIVDEAIHEYGRQPAASGLGVHVQLARVLTSLAERRALERFQKKEN
jgi:transcriptional regulator with XRE-family HTH domain